MSVGTNTKDRNSPGSRDPQSPAKREDDTNRRSEQSQSDKDEGIRPQDLTTENDQGAA